MEGIVRNRITAVVAVRGGSQRVPEKNTRPFAGSNLLAIKIKQLLQVPEFDELLVNSEDNGMLEMAARLGANTVRRDSRFATSTVSMSEVYRNIAENVDSDVVAYCNVTNPLVSVESYSRVCKLYREKEGVHDSVNTVTAIKEFLYLNGQPLNYDPLCQPRSQDLPDIVAINFAISVISRRTMIDLANVVGRRPYLHTLTEFEGFDIDTELDFRIAELLYRGHSDRTPALGGGTPRWDDGDVAEYAWRCRAQRVEPTADESRPSEAWCPGSFR
jgi:CMP-N-acetylneuraminic acid synthetase